MGAMRDICTGSHPLGPRICLPVCLHPETPEYARTSDSMAGGKCWITAGRGSALFLALG